MELVSSRKTPKRCEAACLLNKLCISQEIFSVFSFRILLEPIWTHFTKGNAWLQCKCTGCCFMLPCQPCNTIRDVSDYEVTVRGLLKCEYNRLLYISGSSLPNRQFLDSLSVVRPHSVKMRSPSMSSTSVFSRRHKGGELSWEFVSYPFLCPRIL